MDDAIAGEWSVVSPQAEPVWGTPTHIGVRYSHVGVAHAGRMVVSHGYFYNHQQHKPAWQSDTWSFEPASGAWTKLHAAWSEDKAGHGPSPRYSVSAVVYADTLLMFGGDDGGHLHSPMNYIFGAYSDELWLFDLRAHSWQLVPKPEGAAWPSKRALHGAALVNGRMHVYGGLGVSDHWALCLESTAPGAPDKSGAPGAGWRWLKVRASATVSASDGVDPAYVDRFATAGGPGSRHAIAVAAGGDGRGFYLFGGSRHGKTGFRPKVFDDLWYFREADAHAEVADELLGAWTFLGKARSGAPLPPAWPAARSHHSLVTLGAESGVDVGVLLFGGALCVPGCSCYNDTWVWRPESRRFSPVQVRPRWRAVRETARTGKGAEGAADMRVACARRPRPALVARARAPRPLPSSTTPPPPFFKNGGAQVSEPPIWRYRQSLVSTANDGSFFLFGGESYKPYMCAHSGRAAPFAFAPRPPAPRNARTARAWRTPKPPPPPPPFCVWQVPQFRLKAEAARGLARRADRTGACAAAAHRGRGQRHDGRVEPAAFGARYRSRRGRGELEGRRLAAYDHLRDRAARAARPLRLALVEQAAGVRQGRRGRRRAVTAATDPLYTAAPFGQRICPSAACGWLLPPGPLDHAQSEAGAHHRRHHHRPANHWSYDASLSQCLDVHLHAADSPLSR